MYNLNDFCNIIARLRREKGWSQAVFADRLGISPQSVSKWECGVGLPDVTLFPVIARVLSVNIGVLFGETDEKEYNIMKKQRQKTEHFEEFEVCQSIKVMLGNLCRVEVVDGEREKALIHAVGDPTFLRYFSAEREDNRLLVEIKNPTGSALKWIPYDREGCTEENCVQIFTGCTDSDVVANNYLDLCAATSTNASGNYVVECHLAIEADFPSISPNLY